jgi:hypothetical protein
LQGIAIAVSLAGAAISSISNACRSFAAWLTVRQKIDC